jgi:hypothetical protein
MLQASWNPDWEFCSNGFWGDDAISVDDQTQANTRLYFDFSSGQLMPVNPPLIPPKMMPSLPNYLPDTRNDFLLPSPQENVYLYERCPSGESGPTESGELCSGFSEFVIYDANQQIDIHHLVDPNPFLLTGRDIYNPRLFASVGASWSATGRYLAFPPYPEDFFDDFDLSVYDMETEAYLDTDWGNAKIDLFRIKQWSPTTDKLLFWIIGRATEEPLAEDSLETLRRLSIYDASTQTFIL